MLQGAQVVHSKRKVRLGQLGRGLLVGHRTLRLALKRPSCPLNFPHHVLHARNVLVHLLDLALAFLLALLMLEHACSFLDKRAAVLRLRLQDGIQTTLRDDRVRAGAQPRVVQNVEHVHAPRKRAVDQVFAFGPSGTYAA